MDPLPFTLQWSAALYSVRISLFQPLRRVSREYSIGRFRGQEIRDFILPGLYGSNSKFGATILCSQNGFQRAACSQPSLSTSMTMSAIFIIELLNISHDNSSPRFCWQFFFWNNRARLLVHREIRQTTAASPLPSHDLCSRHSHALAAGWLRLRRGQLGRQLWWLWRG